MISFVHAFVCFSICWLDLVHALVDQQQKGVRIYMLGFVLEDNE